MDSSHAAGSRCLDIAIDHRIRALFRQLPPTHGDAACGGHISIIRDQGHKLGCCIAEVDVTGDLAGPETVGGLAVILQQPRNEHPFDQGATAVIQECETLWALDQMFATVSCNTVNLLRDVSVFDLLPYTTPEEVAKNGEKLEFLGDRFDNCVEAVCRKKPDVVLCAGRYRLPEHWDNARRNQCKGEAWKLEGKGIGANFGRFSIIRLKDAKRNYTQIHRVNAAHPSYALNYHPEYSCFRQLLLLAVSQACSVYAGDWTETNWMDDLRATCTRFSRDLREEPIELHYWSLLRRIKESITSVASSQADPYQRLLQSSLSTSFNDASLALRQILHEQSSFEPFSSVSADTYNLVEEVLEPQGWLENDRIKDTIICGIDELKECFTNSAGRLNFDMERAILIFLNTAEALELIMWDLRPPQVVQGGLDPEIEGLTDRIGGLRL
jgi:hypothetical protein